MRKLIALLTIIVALGIVFAIRSASAGTPECSEVVGTSYTGLCHQDRQVVNGVITGD